MSDLIEISRYLHKIEAFTVTPRSSATEVKAIVKQLDEYETTLGERINALRSKGKADPETNKLIMLANAELTRIKSEARKKLSLELSTSMSWSGSVSCSASSFAPSESSATSPDGRPTITPVGVVPAAAVAAAAPATAQIPDALEIPFSELTIGDQIGEGAFGFVFRGFCCGRSVAIKIAKTRDWPREEREAVIAEIAVLRKVVQPQAVQFWGVSTKPTGELILVSELMQGDLAHLLNDDKRQAFTIEQKLRMLRDAACGLRWLHDLSRIIHRDLKRANLLYDGSFRVKVADFGLSEFSKGSHLDKGGPKGSPLYSAPEVLEGRPFDQSIDVYAFGLVSFEVMFEERVFPQLKEYDKFVDAVCHKRERPVIPSKVIQRTEARGRLIPPQDPPKGFVTLITRCWDHEPLARPNFVRIVAELDAMILAEMVPNETAARFWLTNFGTPTLLDEVPLDQVATAISRDVGASTEIIKVLRPILCSEHDTHKSTGDAVKARNFGLVASWFGPFFVRDHGDLIKEMLALIQEPWFHWDVLSKDEADSRLMERPSGTFLFRVSFKSPITDPFTLSLAISPNKIWHGRISSEPVGPHRYSLTFAPEGCQTPQLIQFSSLRQLVTSQISPKSVLGLTSPCPKDKGASSKPLTY